ncbi:hypothetical protein HKX48_005131 [Thoreauomyces humboldtii]|nr:hypothetical protein HKX48_005131 [Thoreauomyces humboldtii]
MDYIYRVQPGVAVLRVGLSALSSAPDIAARKRNRRRLQRLRDGLPPHPISPLRNEWHPEALTLSRYSIEVEDVARDAARKAERAVRGIATIESLPALPSGPAPYPYDIPPMPSLPVSPTIPSATPNSIPSSDDAPPVKGGWKSTWKDLKRAMSFSKVSRARHQPADVSAIPDITPVATAPNPILRERKSFSFFRISKASLLNSTDDHPLRARKSFSVSRTRPTQVEDVRAPSSGNRKSFTRNRLSLSDLEGPQSMPMPLQRKERLSLSDDSSPSPREGELSAIDPRHRFSLSDLNATSPLLPLQRRNALSRATEERTLKERRSFSDLKERFSSLSRDDVKSPSLPVQRRARASLSFTVRNPVEPTPLPDGLSLADSNPSTDREAFKELAGRQPRERRSFSLFRSREGSSSLLDALDGR